MTADGDAISALAVTLDALDLHLQRSDATVKRSEFNRLSMLHIHAFAAMVVGPLFMALGKQGMSGGSWSFIRRIPGSPLVLGLILFTGGLILAVATAYGAVRWEMLGLWILLVWYATLSVLFGAALFQWFFVGMPSAQGKPSTYAPALYGHFVAIMAVHLRTLYRIRRLRMTHA